LTWTSLLLAAGPAILLFLALKHRDAREPATLRLLVIVYAVAAAVPLSFAVLWRLDATRVAIELHAIAFRAGGNTPLRKVISERRAGSGRIVIGDVASRRVRPGRSFGTLVFTPRGPGNEHGALRVELPPAGQRAGLIGAESAGILGADQLEDKDQLCVAGHCWTYDARARSFTLGKTVTRIPSRQAEIPGVGWTFTLPFASPATATQRTWSLDALAHEASAIPPDRRVRSFLAFTRPGPTLRLIGLDADVFLLRNGARRETAKDFAVGGGERIALYTLPAESSDFAAPPVAERRSMVYRAGERGFALDLDTPEVHSLTVAELHALAFAHEADAKKQVVPLAMGEAQLVDRSLYFSGLSESVAVEANALYELSRWFPRDFQSSLRIVSARGPIDSALGRIQWIGSSDLAAVRLDVLRPPLMLLIFGAVLLLLLKVIAALGARLTTTQAIFAAVLELLLGVRLLIGYRVWSMPPHKFEAAELAVVAWMALPWIFLVACLPLARLASLKSLANAPALAGLLFSMVFIARVVEGRTKWIWLLCHLLALGAASSRTEEARARLESARVWILQRLPMPRGRFFDPELAPIVVAALLFSVVRVLLLFFGFKESANLGVRVSLSVIHIPAAAILQGFYFWLLWQRVQRNGRLQRPDFVAALSILLFVWAIPAAVTSDVGLALLNIPLFALLFLAATRHAGGGRILARALVAAVVLFIAGAPLLRLALPFVRSEEFLLSAASDSNYARFLHFAAPEKLRELATKRGESLAITSAILQSYIRSGVFGYGYGHTEVSGHLGDTALRDFAPAVFIAAEWGLVGTVALILIYLLFAVIASSWLPWSETASTEARAGPAIAFVAAATITVSSIYMILANHELLLLTGKNAYLLGLDSAGDVIEVLVLLLLVAFGSSTLRDEDGVSFGGSA
jgi:hypothetical protein